MRLPRPVIAAALAASLGVITSAQQQPPPPAPADQPIFRSSTRLIVTTVSVKDKDGKPIEGLTAQDFVITEDGQPQDIAFVEFQRLATEAAPALQANAAPATPAAPAQPEVAAVTQAQFVPPATGDTKYRDKRLMIIYFDLSAMQIGDQLRAYQAAIKYVTSQMTSSDLMAVMTYEGGAVRIKQDFTADRAVVRNVIDVLMYGEDKDGDGVRDEPDQSSAFGQGDAEFNIFNTDRQLAALQTAVTMLRPFPEQKALIYFGSGLRLNGNDNTAQLRATTNAAVRANVTINPVDARGLVALSPFGDATQRSPGGQAMFTGQLAMNAMNGFQRSQDTLFALAKDTGGTAMFDNNDLSAGIVQAAQAMTSYYIIGFYSTHAASDGKFRRVKVSLANGKEGELAYRQGYFADKEWARQNGVERERQLEEALMLDNPITDITIAMELNFFQLNRAEYFVPVHVKIPGSELALARRRGAQRTLLDFIGEVKDNYGITIQNVRDKLDIPISDKTATELSARPIQYETGFTLLPGQYVIKFLARDAEAGRLGTYQTSFTIPNLNREEVRLPISSVVLSSQRVPFGEELHTVKNSLSTQAQASNPLVFQGEKLVPSVTRVFSTTKDLYVLLQAYERGATETAPLVAFVTLYKGDVKAFETQPIQVTDGLDARSKAVPLRFSIPLQGIAPGRYECQVTVLEPGGRKAAFWRAPVVLIP
ncbi:MAG TPA: VWA domain-containing protein [Vicinamibacterales bacterium]|nr:VWA domain-containing protein [Vicinamibacterales bacterium]